MTQVGERPDHGLLIDGAWVAGREGGRPRLRRLPPGRSSRGGDGRARRRRRRRGRRPAAAPGWAAARVRAGSCPSPDGRRGGRPAGRTGPGAQRRPGQAARRGQRRGGRARGLPAHGGRGRRAPRGPLPPSVDPGRRMLLQRVPLGVAGIIVPWNWPYTMAAELFAPALAAGNTVVWLAAPTTAACSALFASVLTAPDGLPPGVLGFLNGPAPVAGDALAGHPGVDAVPSSAPSRPADPSPPAAGKAQILELGGNGPLIVLDDADLEAAVDGHPRSGLPVRRPELHSRRAHPRAPRVRASSRAAEAAVVGQVQLGDPFDPRHDDGPAQQRAAWRPRSTTRCGGRRGRGPVVAGGRRRAGFPTPLSSGSRPCSTASRRHARRP